MECILHWSQRNMRPRVDIIEMQDEEPFNGYDTTGMKRATVQMEGSLLPGHGLA